MSCGSGSYQEELVLKNGLRVVFLYKDSPITSAVLLVGCGSAHGEPFITQKVTQLILRGNNVRSNEQIFQEIESLGGKLGAQTLLTVSMLFVQAPEKNFQNCFEILCESISQPSFDEDQIEKRIRRNDLTFLKNKDTRRDQVIRKMLFTGSTLTRKPIDEEPKWDRKSLINHFNNYYKPDNMVLAIVGRFDREAILQKISYAWKSHGKLKKFQHKEIFMGSPAEKGEHIVHGKTLYDRILIGYRFPQTLEISTIPIYCLESLLSYGRSSLLSNWTKYKSMVDYPAYSKYNNEGKISFFMIDVMTPPGSGLSVKSHILNEIEKIKEQGVPEESFRIAKRKLMSDIAIQFQYTLLNAVFLASSTYFQLDYRNMDFLEDKINSVTIDDIKHLAQKYLTDPVVWISLANKKK